jgi:hypothetical protein
MMNKTKFRFIAGIAAAVCVIITAFILARKKPAGNGVKNSAEQITAVINTQIFDGERVIDDRVVILKGAFIYAVGGEIPAGALVVDAKGGTLLSGLIDAHTHTDIDGLADALRFGATTEFEMNGNWSIKQRKELAERPDVADLRSPGMGVTPKGGHPTECAAESGVLMRMFVRYFSPQSKRPKRRSNLLISKSAKEPITSKFLLRTEVTSAILGFPCLITKRSKRRLMRRIATTKWLSPM